MDISGQLKLKETYITRPHSKGSSKNGGAPTVNETNQMTSCLLGLAFNMLPEINKD